MRIEGARTKIQLGVFFTLALVNTAYADTNRVNVDEKISFSIKSPTKLPSFHVGFDSPLMSAMLANSTPFNNELNILDLKQQLALQTLYLGGYGQGGGSFVNASQTTFFYSNNLTYKSRNYGSLDRVALGFIGNVNPWATVYLETGATDIGQPYRSSLRLNQSYVLLGDGTFPIYGFAGYKNIDFGNFSTVNMFAQPITRWDYAGTALTAGAGYRAHGFNITLSAIPGRTQGVEDYYGSGLWRVYNYPNYYTPNHGVNNVAVNTSYSARIACINWTVGAGYVRGLWLGSPTNFFNNATIGAWDANVQVEAKNVTLLAEFVESTPNTTSFGAFIPINPGGAKLKTWDIGASYKWDDFILPRESMISADYSGVIGNNSFAEVTQLVLGAKNNVCKYIWAGVEYVLDDQSSNQGAIRSGLFYRAHDKVQIIRLDVTASF